MPEPFAHDVIKLDRASPAPGLTEGQRVIIVGLEHRSGRIRREAVIGKVGRKWATIVGDRFGDWTVDRFTGMGKPRSGYSATYRAYTPEQLEIEERRTALIKEVRSLTSDRFNWISALSEEKLRALVELLSEP